MSAEGSSVKGSSQQRSTSGSKVKRGACYFQAELQGELVNYTSPALLRSSPQGAAT